MDNSVAPPQHLRDLARLRRVRDRIDREYAQPLNVEVLARDISTEQRREIALMRTWLVSWFAG